MSHEVTWIIYYDLIFTQISPPVQKHIYMKSLCKLTSFTRNLLHTSSFFVNVGNNIIGKIAVGFYCR